MADKRVVEPENLSASADAPEAEGAEQTATTEAKEQLATLTRERDDYYDRLLRKTACIVGNSSSAISLSASASREPLLSSSIATGPPYIAQAFETNRDPNKRLLM